MRPLPLGATIAIAVIAAIAAISACTSSPTSPGSVTTGKAVPIVFTGGTINAEIASTFVRRDSGLMGRTSIAADSGMLFAWAINHDSTTVYFYMHDTHFDLSVAFLDANHVVINIEDMTRDTETPHYPRAAFRYAIEAPLGWFAAHGVTAGAAATFTFPAGVIVDP